MATKKRSNTKKPGETPFSVDPEVLSEVNRILGEQFKFSITTSKDAAAAYIASLFTVVSLGKMLGRTEKEIESDLQAIFKVQ